MKGYSIVTGLGTNMQSLVVQALAMRQLGLLNPGQLLAAGGGLRQTPWCPRAVHTRQLWGCAAPTATSGPGPALHGRDAARGWSVQSLRFKSKKKEAAAQRKREEEEEEDSDDEEVDEHLPKDYKDFEKHVPSFRYDVIMKAGLDIARNKIEDAFYDNKLRLNGQKLIKKSKTVKVGDTLDMVLSENRDTNRVTLMRVIPRKVFGQLTSTDKFKVSMRRWSSLDLPRDEAFQP
ncbi:mitochondrial transcription rescue factor 1 [Brachionichthys hirsutus]|uniref:mitochondrial transcription rescue factor 1 n=1 Tax=Brachionichthys hirsutus TaxID=412623 RepID=UPI003604630D